MNTYQPLLVDKIRFENVIIYKHSHGLVLQAQQEKTGHAKLLQLRHESTDRLAGLVQGQHSFKNHGEAKKYLHDRFDISTRLHSYGLVGFTRFLLGYYMIYIKERSEVALIGKHRIYQIKDVGILPLFERGRDSRRNAREQIYFQKLRLYSFQNCYFSYTYDPSRTLAYNMTQNGLPLYKNDFLNIDPPNIAFSREPQVSSYNQVFLWNYRLVNQLSSLAHYCWVIPISHGFCKTIDFPLKEKCLAVVLLARRSRHQAGTRYIRRGINAQGFVANEVEVEQIVVNRLKEHEVCSYVQLRGSVPVYWFQKPNILIPKPPIQLYNDDIYYRATQKHYRDLVARYGPTIRCINLMREKEPVPRETLLSQAFVNSINYVIKRLGRDDIRISYQQIDMKSRLKQNKLLFVKEAKDIAAEFLEDSGFFMVKNDLVRKDCQQVRFQNGVIRSNCVDCLDRTNSFQSLLSQATLIAQVQALIGYELPEYIYSNTLSNFRTVYEQLGDLISIQYGSSLAHKQKVSQSKSKKLEFLTSLKRHFNNNITDSDRQEVIDTFLRNIDFQEVDQPAEYVITHAPDKLFLDQCLEGWQDKALQYFRVAHGLDYLGGLDVSDRLPWSTGICYLLKKPPILLNTLLWRSKEPQPEPFDQASAKYKPLLNIYQQYQPQHREQQQALPFRYRQQQPPKNYWKKMHDQAKSIIADNKAILASSKSITTAMIAGDDQQLVCIQQKEQLKSLCFSSRVGQTMEEANRIRKMFRAGAFVVDQQGGREEESLQDQTQAKKNTKRVAVVSKVTVLADLLANKFIFGREIAPKRINNQLLCLFSLVLSKAT